MDKIKTFFSDGLSVDEAKVSILILLLIITTLFSLAMYFTNGLIGDNLANIIGWFIFAVSGVNIANTTLNSVVASKIKQAADSIESNDDEPENISPL